MHYANGKAAKIRDKVVGVDASGRPIGGIVDQVYADSDTCNLVVIPTSDVPSTVLTAGECLLASDVKGVPKLPEEQAPVDMMPELMPEKDFPLPAGEIPKKGPGERIPSTDGIPEKSPDVDSSRAEDLRKELATLESRPELDNPTVSPQPPDTDPK